VPEVRHQRSDIRGQTSESEIGVSGQRSDVREREKQKAKIKRPTLNAEFRRKRADRV
jgi:hypothetical protein